MFVILKAPFCSPSFTFLFLYYFFRMAWCFKWELLLSSLFFIPLPQKKIESGDVSFLASEKNPPSYFVKHPRRNQKQEKLIFILLLIGFFFLFGKTNIYFVVDRAVSLVCFRCCPLSFDNSRPVLDDAFSALWCLVTQERFKSRPRPISM